MTKINKDWIKKTIAKTYSSNWEDQMSRELIITKISDQGTDESNIKTRGCIFFTLAGSPPKGYALYVPEHRFITIIDAWGKKKRTYNDKEYVET